jgi:predicted DNA-binding protein (MmcQ/YjbR family)
VSVSNLLRDDLRRQLSAQPGSSEEEPFGPGVWVYKVCGKVFALLTQDGPTRLSLKCDPVRAQELRAAFAAITPGYHLNKEHWNTLELPGGLPPALVDELILHSHDLVVARLKVGERQAVALQRTLA